MVTGLSLQVCANAHWPRSIFAKLGPEIVDNIMGNFNNPTEITNLQMVLLSQEGPRFLNPH